MGDAHHGSWAPRAHGLRFGIPRDSGLPGFSEKRSKNPFLLLFQCRQKTLKKRSKNPPPPPQMLKNAQKTFEKRSKNQKKAPRTLFDEFWPLKATKGGARACARPPFGPFPMPKPLKNVSGESFLRFFESCSTF